MSAKITPAPAGFLLSDAPFLNGNRIAVYSYAATAIYGLLVFYAYYRGFWFRDAAGFPTPTDFVSFWSAGFIAYAGRAPEAYIWELHKQAAIFAIGRQFEEIFPWHYPPTFLLVALPLAWLPYLQAWFLWVALSGAFFLAALRRILPRLAVPVGLAAPTSLACAVVGQNGFLTAGLMAAALALLDRRPRLAGLFLGLLTYKPHFGVLFPLFLALEKRWSTILSAAASAVAFAGISALVFGTDTWRAFFESIAVTNAMLHAGAAGWHKLQSVYALFRQLTRDNLVSWAAHGLVAAGVGALALRVWTRSASPAVKSAALVAASFLVAPYAYVYDAVVLTVAAAFLARDGQERGFGPWEKILLCLACIVPAFFYVLNTTASLVAGFLLLFVAVRRA